MKISFHYGSTLESLNKTPHSPGGLYIIGETEDMYFDSPNGERILLGEMEALSEEELNQLLI